MINKKRQELIIQNLRSISAEVRCMSIEQLVNLPAMPVSEKISCLEPVLKDSDEGVRNLAATMIKKLQGDGSGNPAPVASSPGPVPSPPPLNVPSPSAAMAEPVAPPAAPAFVATPSRPAVNSPLPSSSSAPPIVPELPSIVKSPVPAPGVPAFAGPASKPLQTATVPAGNRPSRPVVPTAIELDDPVDPSLPDLKKVTDIGSLLQHIKTLSTQKPSGHVTLLLQLARHVMEEVALTALQALFNLKDRRVPAQIPPMLAEEQYSSQRRFLMLKIIMETDVDLDYAALESILLKEKDVIVKSGLVKVFARSSREQGVGTLVKCLEDEDPRVRANTVEVIEEQNIRGCEQNIVALLEDPENRVKVNAAKYLVKNGYQQAFLTLRTMLVSPEVWLRDSVIFALGEIGDQPSLTLLKAALKDPNQGIRLSVLKALARINNNTSRQVLKAACGDPDPVVAQVAASLFEKIKDAPMREEVRPGAFPAAHPSPAAPVKAPADDTPPPASVPAAPAPVRPAMPVMPEIAAPQPVEPAFPPLPTEPSLPDFSEAPQLPPFNDLSGAEPEQTVLPPTPLPASVQPAAQQKPAQLSSPGAISKPMPRPPVNQPPLNINIPDRRLPTSPGLSSPARPVSQPSPAGSPPVARVPGMPSFAKPRSAEIYCRLASANVDEQRAGARDIAFVMGDDQMILLAKAATLEDESIRIAAVKLLSRKKTPDAIELLQKLLTDSNETVKSLAEKALQLQK